MSERGTGLLVVIATYNEIDSLPRLLRQLVQQLPAAELLVIDDASPDGTGNWCESSKDTYPRLSVIHRTGKLGLGSAAVEGFQWALARDYQFVATMDADLSHDPVSLAAMYDLMRQRPVGLCIGSRYVSGGATEGWPWYRRLASRAVNVFASITLGLKTKDNSGAFRIYRRDALEQLDGVQIKSTDYAYLEEILWRLRRKGVTMMEYPIVFRNRELGKSKTNSLLGIRVFWQIFAMGIGWRK